MRPLKYWFCRSCWPVIKLHKQVFSFITTYLFKTFSRAAARRTFLSWGFDFSQRRGIILSFCLGFLIFRFHLFGFLDRFLLVFSPGSDGGVTLTRTCRIDAVVFRKLLGIATFWKKYLFPCIALKVFFLIRTFTFTLWGLMHPEKESTPGVSAVLSSESHEIF